VFKFSLEIIQWSGCGFCEAGQGRDTPGHDGNMTEKDRSVAIAAARMQ